MTVMSSDTEAYIGKAINITFEASAGVTGPYDVDLYRGDEEVQYSVVRSRCASTVSSTW